MKLTEADKTQIQELPSKKNSVTKKKRRKLKTISAELP